MMRGGGVQNGHFCDGVIFERSLMRCCAWNVRSLSVIVSDTCAVKATLTVHAHITHLPRPKYVQTAHKLRLIAYVVRGQNFEPFKAGDRAQTRQRVQSLTKTHVPRVKHA